MPDTDILDEERLARLSNQIGAAALSRMLAQLDMRLADADVALRGHIEAKEASAIVQEAHKLAGVAASFAADRIADCARALEQHVIARGTDDLAALAEPLYSALHETRTALQTRSSGG